MKNEKIKLIALEGDNFLIEGVHEWQRSSHDLVPHLSVDQRLRVSGDEGDGFLPEMNGANFVSHLQNVDGIVQIEAFGQFLLADFDQVFQVVLVSDQKKTGKLTISESLFRKY